MSSSNAPAPPVAKTAEKGAFYGVYLLVSENAAFRGRTYIGFTVDPARRLRQHNRGSHAGGAWRTSSKGPWSMVLITHGFPNEVSALRVEWAWQHPASSRRLRGAPRKRSSESRLQYSVRLLGSILRTAPWCALPLTVTWLDQRYHTPFPDDLIPPPHIAVAFCGVAEVKKSSRNTEREDAGEDAPPVCSLCARPVEGPDKLKCLHTRCLLISHVVCLGQYLASHPSRPHPTVNQPPWVTTAPATDLRSAKKQALLSPAAPLLPVEGACPACGGLLLWGDLVRLISVACANSRGTNRGKGVWVGPEQHNTNEAGGGRQEQLEMTDDESGDEDHWANMLTQRQS